MVARTSAKKQASSRQQPLAQMRPALKIGELLPNPLHTISGEEAATHKKIEEKINFKAPLLAQLDKLSSAELVTLLSRPHHPVDERTKYSVKLASDDTEEKLLKSSLLTENVPYLGLAAQLCLLVGFCASDSFVDFIASFVVCYILGGIGGMCGMGEYLLHRFMFNPQNYLSKSDEVSGGDRFKKLLSAGDNHCIHHIFMQDSDHITTPYKFYLRLIPAIMAVLYFMLPLKAVALLGGGLFTGSLVSDALHYSFHFGPSLNHEWWRYMKASHMKHHFLDNTRDFGITNTLADRCMGTQSDDHKRSVELQRMQRGDLLWNVKSLATSGPAGSTTTKAALKKP